MKLFISADIEGCAGVSFSAETHKQEAVYAACAAQMTAEVLAVCEAAHEAGAAEIVVKDGHGDASNIDPLRMPEYVTLIRGKSGHPYNMMYGLDGSFDGVLYLGYHAPAGSTASALSHTSTGNSLWIELNGERMSEFLLNSYTAASYGVPVIFLSGDAEICRLAREKCPAVETVVTKHGEGEAVWCEPPGRVMSALRSQSARAVRRLAEQLHRTEKQENAAGQLSQTEKQENAGGQSQRAAKPDFERLPMPERFRYEVCFKEWKKAYRMSFYPGMRQLDSHRIAMESELWLDIATAHSFVVY